nr:MULTISPECIES: ECF-type sigma factor [unclassified Butyricicoccus]
MKNWQKNRNYKRVKDKDGNVVANIISVYGQDVKVSDEVFTAYSQMDRQERYAEELLMAEREISWEYTREEGIHIETLENAEPSAEEICIKHENVKMRAEQVKHLPVVFAQLNDDEKRLIDALYFRGLGVREYAREIGVSHTRVRRERDCILEKLKKYFSKF